MAGERRRLLKDSRAAGFITQVTRGAGAARLRPCAPSRFRTSVASSAAMSEKGKESPRMTVLATDNNLPQGHRVAAPDVKSYEQITADIELTNAHLKWQDERFLQTEGRYSAPRGNCVKHGLNSIA
jgi:hypothetical protein